MKAWSYINVESFAYKMMHSVKLDNQPWQKCTLYWGHIFTNKVTPSQTRWGKDKYWRWQIRTFM